MEMRLSHTDEMFSEIRNLLQRWVVALPGLAQIRKNYMNSVLKLFFIPVLFALSTYAMDYTDVHTLRTALDPVISKFPGVEGSAIGNCVRGTDKDPFLQSPGAMTNIDMCLVYFVKSEALIPGLRMRYKMLRIQTPIAVRFQKSVSADLVGH
tara:strand:- start:22631 stop:23086 length:456 start_codon:yes stop_codon:yes gene_type:complete